jgi:hypothetical protein
LKLLKYILAYYKFLKTFTNAKLNVNFRQKIDALKNGFFSDNYIVYNLFTNNPLAYISDFTRIYHLPKINNIYSIILDDKRVFFDFFYSKTSIVPIIGFINYGKCFDLNYSTVNFFNLLQLQKALVLKPATGGGGFGILIIEHKNDLIFINNKESTINEVELIIKKLNNYIINEKIQQTGWSQSVYPNSLNTIRILTIFDKLENKSKIITAVHRFGTEKSINVDNWSSGGINFKINIENGKLGKGACFPLNNKIEWLANHPNSKITIENEVIKNWDDIKSNIIELSSKIPYIPYIGWDIIPMDNSFIILEANSNSDVNLLQIHGGLWADIDIKRIYKSYVLS